MNKIFRGLLLSLSLAAASLAHADDAVTSTIVIGQSAALSGPQAEAGKAFRDGAMAYFEYINAKGGIHGRKIELKTVDDGGVPERAAANTKDLMGQNNVIALFGYTGTATSLAAVPLAQKSAMPFFAPLSGAKALRDPFLPNVYHVRASYAVEAERIVNTLGAMGAKKVAVFLQNDAVGQAGLEAVREALKKRQLGVTLIGVATVERSNPDISGAVAKLKGLQARAVIMFATPKTSATIIGEMRKDSDVPPYFWNTSYAGSDVMMGELRDDAPGLMFSQVVPSPYNEKIAVVREYKKLLAAKPGRERGPISLEGFISAKVLVEGLNRASKNLTPATLTQALDNMSVYDAGGYVVNYSAQDHLGSKFVETAVVDSGGQLSYGDERK